jgi:hypothetical protein
VEDNLTTALIAKPIRQGWLESADGLELVPKLTAEAVAQAEAMALLGSVDACLLADRFTIITDVGVASRHNGAVALRTSVRPDELDEVSVTLDGVSRTAEAIARATVARFFGITVNGYERESLLDEAVVFENLDAFIEEPEPTVINDLVRAWFIMSGLPVATHVLVVPNAFLANDPDAVAGVVDQLKLAATTGVERRREIRRNLHEQFPGDRDRLVAFHTEQTLSLTKTVRKGWLDLLRRVGHAMALPAPDVLTFRTLGSDE